MKKLELLAPAKNLESGIAAINAGADAVYIGAEQFGARAAAGNSVDDIGKLVEYSHLFHVKIYVTLNTILYDNELPNVESLIQKLYNIGVDGLIIQDMGILEFDLPNINIIASTQTNNRTVEKIKFLENIGFSRVILARELSITEINEIKAATNIELEFFIHGALNKKFQLQCYFSQEITGRSANRGECAQPCRSAYDLIDSEGTVILKNKHLFSLKDLNLSEKISALANAGISSFKIEGRLKNISYVKNVTAYYRNLIDQLILSNPQQYSRASSGKTILRFTPNIESVFNRGFSTYFVDGRQSNLASFDTQKSLGEYIGKVQKIVENTIVVKTDKIINNNDGLCFFKNTELLGVKVNKATENKITVDNADELFVNAELYRNYNHKLTQEVEREDSAIRKINISVQLIDSIDALAVVIVDEDQIESILYIIENLQEANNKEKAIETIINQFSKEGDSIYSVNNVEIKTAKSYFFPISKLNEIRRQAFENHNRVRIELHVFETKTISKNKEKYIKTEISYSENVANKNAIAFYQNHGVGKIELAFEKLKPQHSVPILTSRYCLKFEMGVCPKFKNVAAYKFVEPLYIVNNKRKYRLSFDCATCEMTINR